MITRIKKNQRISDADYIEEWEFENGYSAPIYEVKSSHALTQMVGYAKYLNRHCGPVYYRGQQTIHRTLKPSLCRLVGTSSLSTRFQSMDYIVTCVMRCDGLANELRLEKSRAESRGLVEATLQHYGIPTRFIDAVDNHWVALWFGSHSYESRKVNHETYAIYHRRDVSFLDTVEEVSKQIHRYGKPDDSFLGTVNGISERIYQYVFMMAADSSICDVMDLRFQLPSTFLRPHAQHGVILRGKNESELFDLAGTVVGILRIRVDRALRWLGGGQLTSYANLFPSPMHDKGYCALLEQQAIFEPYGYRITRYAYDVE